MSLCALSESYSLEERVEDSWPSFSTRNTHLNLIVIRYLHGPVLRRADQPIDFLTISTLPGVPHSTARSLTNEVCVSPVENR